jgi:hypothetical protein
MVPTISLTGIHLGISEDLQYRYRYQYRNPGYALVTYVQSLIVMRQDTKAAAVTISTYRLMTFDPATHTVLSSPLYCTGRSLDLARFLLTFTGAVSHVTVTWPYAR